MAKTASSSLFQLIQSLTQTEKRYLKLFLQKNVGGESDNYARLFDGIDSQTDYDESKLKSFPHLAVMKVRLEETILWSLRDFHSGKSINSKLKADIRSVEILFEKGLLDLARRQLLKAKKTAVEYEEYLPLFELLKWEIKIANAQGYISLSEQGLKDLYREADECLEKVLNANQYAFFSDSVYIRIRKAGFFRNESDFKKFAKMIKHPMLRSDEKAASSDAKYYFHSTHIGFSELQADYHSAYAHNKKILAHLEAQPAIIRKQPRQYLSMLQNTLVWQYQLKEYRQAIESAEKLKQFTIQQKNSLSENLYNRTYYFNNTFLLLVHSRLGEYEKGTKLVKQFTQEFTDQRIRPTGKEAEWMFYDACAITFFGVGNFSEASKYQNKIIQDNEEGLRSDMQSMSRIFALIVHFELGNQELLRYMVKWTYRFLIKRNRLYKFETIILEFIRKKIQHLNTRKERVDAFIDLKKELEKLLPDRFQRRPLDDFEFTDWLESKIQNKPFAEIVQKKYAKRL